MKKRLTALLIIILLFALFAVVASAQLAPSSSTQYGLGYIDFESDAALSTDYSKGQSGKLNVSGFSVINGNHTKISVIDGENNNYLQFKDNGAPSGVYSRNASWELYTGPSIQYEEGLGSYLNEYSTSQYDFYVMEFDIASDSYVYTYNKGDSSVETTADFSLIPDGAQIVEKKLAYVEGMLFSNVIDAAVADDSNPIEQHLGSIMLGSDGGDWYVYAGCDGNLVNTGAKLTREISAWNHFTIAVKIDRENSNCAHSEQYTFLDGHLINQFYIGSETDSFSDFSNKQYKIELPNAQIMDKRNLYSFGIDNLSINYYMRTGSNYENAYSFDGYSLEDYFCEGDTSAGIYNCLDIVYNNSYISSSPMAYVDDVPYYSMNSALSAVCDGSVVRLERGLDNYLPTVNSLTVIADGVKFSLSESATDYSVEKSENGGVDTYTVTYVGTNGTPDGEEDEDAELYRKVFDGAKYNLTTTSGFVGNFYVKVPSDGADYEVDVSEESGCCGITEIEGESYYKFASESAVGNITAEIVFSIKINADGVEKTLEARYTIDSYFLSAMQLLSQKSEPTDYEKLQKKLVMDATRYANELYKYVNSVSEGYGKYEEILSNDDYSANLTSYDELDIVEDAEIDFSGISSVVVGFGFAVNEGYSASYVLYVADEAVNSERIKVTYKSITGETLENKIDPTLREYQIGTKIFYYFACSDMPIYEMIAPQQVTVTFDDGEHGSAYFTLPLYIANQSDGDAVSLAKAMYAYAKASYSFKSFNN